MEKHWDVIYKVPLYLADLVSDWLNGGSMVVQWWSHWIEFIATHDNTTTMREYEAELAELGIPYWDWGVITIAMSWIPAAFSVLWICSCCILSALSCSLWHRHLVRFILWPILVPIDM